MTGHRHIAGEGCPERRVVEAVFLAPCARYGTNQSSYDDALHAVVLQARRVLEWQSDRRDFLACAVREEISGTRRAGAS